MKVISSILLLIFSMGLCSCSIFCSDNIDVFTLSDAHYEWVPTDDSSTIAYSSSSGLTESFRVSLLERQTSSGSKNRCLDWEGQYTSFRYKPHLFDREFDGKVNITKRGFEFSIHFNNRLFVYLIDKNENIKVQNVSTNDKYVSQIAPVDSIVVDGQVVRELLSVRDPVITANSNENDIIELFFAKRLGIVKFIEKGGTVWERDL